MTGATIRQDESGQLVLDDPQGAAVIGTIERMNLYAAEEAAMLRLRARAVVKSTDVEKFVVLLIDVDDPTWRALADVLMPGHNWQQYRDLGQRPIARGVVQRGWLSDLLRAIETTVQIPDGMFTAVFALGGFTIFEAQP